MKNLHNLDVAIDFGSWSGQLPHMSKSYMVRDETAEKIVRYAKNGYKIIVGNYPGGKGKTLSCINSRYHGYSIRTIRAVKEVK